LLLLPIHIVIVIIIAPVLLLLPLPPLLAVLLALLLSVFNALRVAGIQDPAGYGHINGFYCVRQVQLGMSLAEPNQRLQRPSSHR
jgi:hypothetical protein